MTDQSREAVTLTRVDVGEPFEVLSARYVTQRFTPHAHDHFAFGVIEEGASVLGIDGRDVLIPSGSIVAINPGVVHTGGPADSTGWTYRMFYPTVAFITEIAEDMGSQPGAVPEFHSCVFDDPQLAETLVTAHHRLEWAGGSLTADTVVFEAFGEVIRRLTRHDVEDPSRTPARSVVLRAKEYLDANWRHRVRISDISRECGLSKFHLIRTFNREIGLPPYRYLEIVRARHARDMLRRGDPLSDVVAAAGYSDQSHLTRHFKRVFGVTPGSYARSWRR